jgi:hypothetical protein
MKIKCIYNTGENIPKDLFSLYGYSENMIFEKITIGNIYIVYAIFTMKGRIWYLICSDWYDGAGLNFPEFFSASLFEIIDESPSKYWISTFQNDDYDNSRELVLNTGFPNIINEEYFYGNLLEDKEREVNLFKKYKYLIDMEKEL